MILFPITIEILWYFFLFFRKMYQQEKVTIWYFFLRKKYHTPLGTFSYWYFFLVFEPITLASVIWLSSYTGNLKIFQAITHVSIIFLHIGIRLVFNIFNLIPIKEHIAFFDYIFCKVEKKMRSFISVFDIICTL